MRRALRLVSAGVMSAGLLAGLPWLLTVLTARLLDSSVDWAGLVAQPLSAAGVVIAMIVVGWVVWAWLVVATVLDMVHGLRRSGRRRVQLPVPMHAAVGTVTSTALLLVDAVAGRGTVPRPLPPTGPAIATTTNVTTTQRPPDTAPQTPENTRVVQAERGRQPSGVQFVGGWLPLPAATLAVAAVTMLWAQRRRHYQPRHPSGAVRADADLEPTPAALAGLRRGVDLAVEDDTADDTADLAPDPDWDLPSTDTGPVIGVIDGRWLRPGDLPAGGLGVTGPGAPGALRGLLTTLLTAALSAGNDGWQIVITAEDAKALLGIAAPQLPRLHLAPDDAAALDHIEHTVTPDTAAPADAGVLLIQLQPPTGDQAARLQTVLTATHGRTISPVTAVLGGAWTSGQTWHVADDGTTLPLSPPLLLTRPGPDTRLAVLNASAAAALIAILHDAAPPHRAPTEARRPDMVTQAQPGPPDPSELSNGRHPSPTPSGRISDGEAVPRRLRLRVLGPVTLLRPHPDGSASTVHIRRTASLQLLVYLAIHRDGAANDELKEALWPDVANSAATRRLATNLYELRRVLEDAAGGTVLHRTTSPPDGGNTRFQLDRDLIQVDLWQLHDLLNTATTAAGSTGRATLLHAAAALDRGALAQGLPGEWLDIDRETTARHLVDVYVHLADLETDDHAALQLLRRATEVAPHNEPLYRAVMRRHAAANDPNGVRSVLATAMARLAELGTAPDDETLNLAAGLCADLETATGNTAETTTSPGQEPR